ncbi:MAG: hypothetical protein ABJ208_27185, partial [Rhodopirellula bahusiensis]
ARRTPTSSRPQASPTRPPPTTPQKIAVNPPGQMVPVNGYNSPMFYAWFKAKVKTKQVFFLGHAAEVNLHAKLYLATHDQLVSEILGVSDRLL